MSKTVRQKFTKSAQMVHKKLHKEFVYYTVYVCDNFAFSFISLLLDYQCNQGFLHH